MIISWLFKTEKGLDLYFDMYSHSFFDMFFFLSFFFLAKNEIWSEVETKCHFALSVPKHILSFLLFLNNHFDFVIFETFFFLLQNTFLSFGIPHG